MGKGGHWSDDLSLDHEYKYSETLFNTRNSRVAKIQVKVKKFFDTLKRI